ncbi:MAG: S8 family serine peptidase [Clostridia bacterium]|nr:S8 family serine peptidase [Clostridia bacterium]
MTKKLLCFVLVGMLLFASLGNSVFAVFDTEKGMDEEKIAVRELEAEKTERLLNEVKAGYSDSDSVRIVVKMAGKTALEKAKSVEKSGSCQKKIISAQKSAIAKVEDALGHELHNTKQFALLFNGFAFDGKASDIDTINSLEGVLAYAAPSFEPEMATSNSIIGAQAAWASDYTGAGSSVAIIDTGILLTHDAFSVAPQEVKYTRSDVQQIVEENEYIHAGEDASQLYKNAKVPFAYNYYYGTYDPSHSGSDHGTHVAGIAAGNNGAGFKGVAYDAQLVVMQVFAPNGGANWIEIMEALEDCAYMNVDSVNMSLGSDAGFTSVSDEDTERALSLLRDTGVLVAAASGNATSVAESNRHGGYQLAINPDKGIVGSPSTYDPCLSVASSNNRAASYCYVEAYGFSLSCSEPSAGSGAALFSTLRGEHTYVDCGLGYADSFPGSVAGGIALVQRGDITFTEKAANAAAAGAIGIIVYNNVSGSFNNVQVSSTIPFVTMSDSHGEFLVRRTTDGVGTLSVVIDSSGSLDQISYFSSVGTTADMKIKPEITAPGGNIVSALGSGNTSYGAKSGTSMATPHVAGGMALVKAYVMEKMPTLTNAEAARITNAILMGTATQMNDQLVTSQGAGLMNLNAATSTNVYLSVSGGRPKLELDESEDYRWRFSIDLTNFGTEPMVYDITSNYMMEKATAISVGYVTDCDANDVTALVQVSGDEKVAVMPGNTETVTLNIDASGVMEVYGSIFTRGALLEGFITFESDDETQSVPLLGFMGDWDYASMLDRGFYWQLYTGEQNLQSNGSLQYNAVYSSINGSNAGVGINPYGSDSFNSDHGAISPNGDGVLDNVSKIIFSALRNSKDLSITVETPSATWEVYHPELYSFKKDFMSTYSYTYTEISLNYAGAELQEGETAYIKLTSILDHEGYLPENNETGVWVIPVTLDTTAPAVYVDGDKIAVYDEHYLARTALYSSYNGYSLSGLISETKYSEDERGQTAYLNTTADVVYLEACDYAGNKRVYEINMTDKTVTNSDPMLVYKANDEIFAQMRLATGSDTFTPEDEPFCSGVVFSGWDAEVPESMTAQSMVVNAVFDDTNGVYTVEFTDGDGNVTDTQYVREQEAATEPQIPEKEGYTFTGWDTDFSNVTCDLKVNAQYSVNEYVLSYYLNDTVYEQITYAYGKNIEEVASPEWEGYTFTGWSEIPNTMPAQDIRIDGTMEKDSYQVLYYVDGSLFDAKRYEFGETIEHIAAPEKEDYVFVGWSDLPETMPAQGITTEAVYANASVTVTFCDHDGTVISTQTVEYGGSAQAPEAPVHEGYTFTGWDKDFSNVTEDITVTAQYEINVYTVTFCDYDGTVISTQEVEHGASATAPEAPTRTGYTFAGWDKDFSNVTEDITVTAQYDKWFDIGDVNMDGVINTADAVIILKNVAGLVILDDNQMSLADPMTDGFVNTADAVIILKYAAGLITEF